jgi:hypothetical protein
VAAVVVVVVVVAVVAVVHRGERGWAAARAKWRVRPSRRAQCAGEGLGRKGEMVGEGAHTSTTASLPGPLRHSQLLLLLPSVPPCMRAVHW